MDENKVLDCSFMDDDSFSTMREVVTDMAENGTKYVTRTEDQDRYSHYTSLDLGAFWMGIVGVLVGGAYYLWDNRKLKKLKK